MLRAVVLAAAVFLVRGAAAGQALSVLHSKVVLVEAQSGATPVPRHRLLISDNPATAAPRLIVTGPDGTADVKLRPGNYTVESDRPVAFHGKAYQWTQIVDVPADHDAVLELTASNADAASLADAATTGDRPSESDPAVDLSKWQDSVGTLSTPARGASGFVIDARGLIATNQRVIGTSTSVEVQFTPSIKVMGSVLVADRAKDVAVVLIDSKALGSAAPVSLGCQAPRSPVVGGQKIFAIT